MSGALYESIFVVEISSTGADILSRMEPAFLVVKLRFGIGGDISAGLTARLVVKALERLDILGNLWTESELLC